MSTNKSERPWPSVNARGYRIPEQLFGDIKSIKVIAIGAGISGICLAHDVQERGKNIDLTIYEMGSDVGGTWFWNQYPGCRCDIPSVNYQMSWCPNPNWREFYGTAEEIQSYYKGLVDKFGLGKYINLNHEVIYAEWLDDAKKWRLRIRGPDAKEFDAQCDVFVNAGGVLNTWKWPKIEGLHDFKGVLCHTARWPKDLDYKGKRIAVIGCGSSGIQVLATMQPDAKQIYHWIRSPTWITSAFAQQYAGPGGTNFRYTEAQKKLFAEDPYHSLKYRKMIESDLNQRFKFIVIGTPEQKAVLAYADADMRRRLQGDERLIDAIVPKDFIVGCRRPTPGNGYLEALLQPNVRVDTKMFQKITEKGFIDADGKEVEVDIIVCATGFDTSFVPRFPLVARGRNVQDRWAQYPVDVYMSLAVKDVPNYLMYYGPHGPTGHGSGAPMIEALTGCFMKILKKMQMENITTMTINSKAVDDFNEHRELYLKRTAWSGQCSSWFKPGPGASPIMFPGNRVLFIELLTNFRFEDWDYEYDSANNRFGYLGDGFTMREHDGRDTTFYYGLLDGKDKQPNYSDLRSTYMRSDM
ncbi:FAD/NAD-P-binding domain-containing protein [Armillaria nabsnona]|nr:FAD/NAD-P-binding domain-containing protein [Armillaria nabsnona]